MNILKEKENSIIKKIKDRIGEDIICDGIINDEKWMGKIKFVLKEVNEKDYSSLDWKYSLPELLLSLDNVDLQKKFGKTKKELEDNLRPTWHNIALWTQGIHSMYDKGINSVIKREWCDVKDNSEWFKELQNISIINVKKTPGAEKSDDKELEAAIQKYGDLIWEQITQGSPQIVIFCGTGYLFSKKSLWDEKPHIEWKENQKGFEYYKENNIKDSTVFIKFWHPNARYPHNMMYYALMDIVSELREKYNI